MLNKSSPVASIVSALLVLAAAACTSPPPRVTPTAQPTPTAVLTARGRGDTLYILNPQAPTNLNPHLSLALKDTEASRITYEPLASFDKDGQLIPFLAAEIPSLDNGGVALDGKSVTWKLRQDVQWSDGNPFSADDVQFTYQFISNPDVKAATAATYAAVANVELIDRYTVKVTFKDKNPAWFLPFVGLHGMIIPRHVFEAYNGSNAPQAPANTLPVGTGPYRVKAPGIKPQEVLFLGTQLVETNKIVFEPNPYFREEDKPFFSRVELRGGGTPAEAARLVLQDGSVQYAYSLGQLPPEDLASLEQGGPGQLSASFGSAVERILLNRTDPKRATAEGERSSLQFTHPFLSELKVRQAFAYAIDRQAIAALYGPAGRPTTNSLVSPPQYNSPNVFYDYDPAKAKTLLDEAGWVDADGDGVREKDGVKLEVVFQGKASEIVQQTQQLVKDMLESIGVEVVIKITDSSIMFGAGSVNPDSTYRFNADIQELSIKSASPDPSGYMRFWTCGQIPQQSNDWRGLNIERWCSEEYDALYQQSASELDPEKRQQLFIQMNDMLTKDVVMIPIVHLADVQGVSRDIEGVDLTPWDANTWNIKDWRRK
jgi:peptide/nickel transport system substrate-binding protein